ncbi:MAG: pilus assembly protein PilM [Candidatus Omnitrophota bacterium]
MKNKSFHIVELDENNAKILRAVPKGLKPAITSIKTYEGSGREVLNKIFSHIPPNEHSNISISLPRPFFLMRFVKLPSLDMSEIERMLEFQLAKLVPYPLSEVLFDFSIAQLEEDYCRVIVFVIQKKKIKHLLDYLNEKAITPKSFTITSAGLWQWMLYEERRLDYPAAVIDIDRSCADFLVLDNKKMIFSRSFTYSSDTQFKEGLKHSLMIFKKEFSNKTIKQAFFTGLNNENFIDKSLFDKTESIDCWQNFPLKKGVRNNLIQSCSFASILGLSQSYQKLNFDFSSEDVKGRRALTLKKKRCFDSVIIFFEMLIIGLVALTWYVVDRWAYLDFLDLRLDKMKVEVAELDKVAKRLKVLDKDFLSSAAISDMLYTVVASIPENVQLTLVDLQEKGEISLKGYTDNISGVFGIVKILNSSPLFGEVDIKYASQVKRKNKTEIEFYIEGKQKKGP